MIKLSFPVGPAARTLAATAILAFIPLTSAEAQRYRDGDHHRFERHERHDRYERHDYDRSGFRCVAEARRLGGDGPPIPGIRGRAFGRGACGEALSECNFELNRYRRQTGDAPYARCVIIRRG
ncbi:MAG: hypothetical protein SH859_12625 [Hyphomicrobium aestuarii]|nr:hypothetical protein [Hyphomicrobium aestuarii]